MNHSYKYATTLLIAFTFFISGMVSAADYDLDLTRNDPGAYGGSYSLDNFFPIDGTSSKVYYLTMPSEILVGGSNAVTGYSFDR